MKTTSADTTCPTCRLTVATATGVHREPRPGDLSVCLHCGAVCVFTLALSLIRLTADAAKHYNPYLVLDAICLSDRIRAERRH